MYVFLFNDTATTEIYTYLHTLSLHDALPISAELWITAARSAGLSGPNRDEGGRISVRSTGVGAPSACSSDTSASPTFRSVIAVATSTPGLARNVSAAALLAFWSPGVKARRACCTR